VSTAAKTPEKANAATPSEAALTIDLRDPWLAAFLGWLWPGLGHIYQRRWGKGGLFMTCILATFFYGLWLGGGRVVYASFRDADTHYAYLCQVGVGLPALPAVVQSLRVGGPTPKAPLWDGLMAPPMVRGQLVPRDWAEEQQSKRVAIDPDDREFASDNFIRADANDVYRRYVPSGGGGGSEGTDQAAYWQYKLGSFWDLGTVFTMIAGLLNVLAVWDAWGGPAVPPSKVDDDKKDEPSGEHTKK
jgi:hypothetical protein